MIDIITFYLGGRDKYLTSNMTAAIVAKIYSEVPITHHLILQGCEDPDLPSSHINSGHVKIHRWEENIGLGLGLERIKSELTHPYCMKLDDDAKILDPEQFAIHFEAIVDIAPDMVWSPYPVGLIGNPGGVHTNPKQHTTHYSDSTDTWYTFRMVPHIGGFARISPTQYILDCPFPDDRSDTASGAEDGVFSTWCKNNGVPMAYLENALVVEHQESTLGQHKRYGKAYFGNRT